MDDLSASDCSWKKMVIAKSNNKWISTIKSEQMDTEETMNTINFSLSDVPVSYHNIKKERIEENVTQPDYKDDESNVLLEDDPLSLQSKPVRVSRRSSGSKAESPEERAARLAKMSAYASRRLANESPEQRAMRLKHMSEYAAKRLATETSEQRAKRLARMSAYAARRLASETPEQREARLTRMSAYAARRHAIKKICSQPKSNTNIDNMPVHNYINMPKS